MPDGLDNANQKNITIILADDHTMMREGTRRLLEEDEQLKVIGEAETGTQAISLCRQLHPDIIVLDIAMKETNGFRVARELLSQRGWKPGILVLTAYDQVAYVRAMLNLGVQGYWLKTARGSDIRAAVHLLAMGKESIAPDIYRLLREDVATTPINGGEPLTSRELAVLLLVVSGLRNREIAQQLTISVKTVETHLTSIYNKLGVQSRAEAIALAQRQSLLLQGD